MGSVTVINRIVVKQGKMKEFLEAQRRYAELTAPNGLVGGRMYRSLDGQSAVLVSTFSSKSEQEQVMQRSDFKEHIQRLQPLVESSTPSIYEEAYTTGGFR
jgi:quinol monooxygenase YgiN